jgi:hypothetical protein
MYSHFERAASALQVPCEMNQSWQLADFPKKLITLFEVISYIHCISSAIFAMDYPEIRLRDVSGFETQNASWIGLDTYWPTYGTMHCMLGRSKAHTPYRHMVNLAC